MGRLVAKARIQARFFCACAFSASLLVEPLACSRSDAMQSYGQKRDAAKPAVAGTPSLAKDPKQEADSAIKSKTAEMAAPIVFKYLRSDAPLGERREVFDQFANRFGEKSATEQLFKFLSKTNCQKEEKFRVVDLFIQKHGIGALASFYLRAMSDLGTDFTTSKKDMAKDHPETVTYIQAVAYAISRFGTSGFFTADEFIEKTANFGVFQFPFVSKEDTPLTTVTAMLAIERMAADGSINHANAIKHLSKKYLLLEEAPAAGTMNLLEDPLQPLSPKEAGKFDIFTMAAAVSAIRLIDKYNPKRGKGALNELLEDPKLNPSARSLVENELKKW